MARKLRILALCGISILELQGEKSAALPSKSNVRNVAAASMRGTAPLRRSLDKAGIASAEDGDDSSWGDASWPASDIEVGQENEDEDNRTSRFTGGFRPLSKPQSGAWLQDTPGFAAEDVATRRLYGLPVRDIAGGRSDFFHCKTKTCGIHDKFYELRDNRTKVVHENHQCGGAMPKALSSFRTIATEQCIQYAADRLTWHDCRSMYCDMYEKIVIAVTNGTEYYFGGECHDLLTFNKTICMTYYRDASSFCECICPALMLYEGTRTCRDDILAWLMFGRRGGPLIARYGLSPLCQTYFCKWVEKISDPRHSHKDAPTGCFNIQLPFQRSQCANLMQQAALAPVFQKYDPCPWDQASTTDFMMKCTDGHTCDVRVETWACCQRHASRVQCPKNFPVMCADPLECVGESDHCCVEEALDCKSGVRQCSPLMRPNMPEWYGEVPENIPAYLGPTTTMSIKEFQLWLSRQPKATTQPESWGEDIIPYIPAIAIPIALLLALLAILACYRFGLDTWKLFNGTFFGSRRLLMLYQTDIKNLFSPDDAPRDWPELPPKESHAERLRREADEAAQQALEDTCRIAFTYGRIHLVSVHFATGHGPQQQGRDLRAAVANVRARGLQDVGDNPRLIEEGLTWCDILDHETRIVHALEKAYPSLTVDFNNLTTPPVPGAPWAATTVGHAVECDKRREVWAVVEELQYAIKVAEEGGACTGLTTTGHELMRELIARTPELPADRCVLDPTGKGVKLLPKGRQRGLWHHTGETYMYEPDKEKAGELNDFELPSTENLMGTSVAAARPVCALYVAGSCKLGKRCPWRHCKPVKGDSLREPVFHK